MQKQNFKIIFLLCAFLIVPKNVSAMIHLTEPIAISSATTLVDDYDCDQSCFIVKGNNYVFDFGGHTVTYGNYNTVTVPNDTFSSWISDTLPSNWTVTNGLATKTSTIYPFGSAYDATLSATANIKSDNFTLNGGKTYVAFAFARGSFDDSYLLEVVSASDDVVLVSQTVNGGILNRGYGDSGDPSNNLKYKPTVNTDVYLRFTGIGTGTKILGMLSMKPAFDYGIVQGSYQSSIYEPDGPNLYGGVTNVTI